jgi:glycerophosphoryl diester phosphodiesterase
MYIIAHRGDSAHAPENTLAAFSEVKNSSASWIEFDVMLTADDQVIVIHDSSLKRTTNGRGWVNKKSWSYIKTLDAGGWFDSQFIGEGVPSLHDVLQLAQSLDLKVNIEIKPCGDTAEKTTQLALDLIKRTWKHDKSTILLSSFNRKCLVYALRHQADIPRGLLLSQWNSRCCELAQAYQCQSIHLNHRALTPARGQYIKEKGYQLHAYTVNEKSHALRLQQWGVDAIFSDNPKLLDDQEDDHEQVTIA